MSVRVRFYGECAFSGCDMPFREKEYDELPDDEELEDTAHELLLEWVGLESWYEVIEDEDDD